MNQRFTLQEDNDDKHAGSDRRVLEWPSWRPDLSPTKPVQRDLKKGRPALIQPGLTGLERVCREEQQNAVKSRCANFVTSCSRSVEAAFAAQRQFRKVPIGKTLNWPHGCECECKSLSAHVRPAMSWLAVCCTAHLSFPTTPPQKNINIRMDGRMDAPIYSSLSRYSLLNA